MMKFTINKVALIALMLNAFLLNISSMQLSQYNCKSDSVEHPWLGEILDLYASYNYKTPESIKDLELFADEFYQVSPKDIPYFETLQQITFPQLYTKGLTFIKANCTLKICFNDEVLAQSDIPLCCDSAEYYANNVEWTIAQRKNGKNICFYDIDGRLVLKNNFLKDSFIEGQKKWMTMYNEVNPFSAPSGTFNEFILVEYKYGKGFSFLCSDYDSSLAKDFWNSLKQYLISFCSQHKIERIIFFTGSIKK